MSKNPIQTLIELLLDAMKSRKPFKGRRKLIFTKVSIDGIEITGRIHMVKLEFSQAVTFAATPLDRRGKPAKIEAGTAVWSVAATDVDGNDVSGELTLSVDPTNELSATVTSAQTALTGTLTLRADGDPKADEVVDVVATASIIVDAPNVVALSLSNTDPVDV